VNFYVHIALDSFGAEALGRAAGWLRRIADPAAEHHIYVWAGSGDAPADNDYWADRYPVWDDYLKVPTVSTSGLDVDRRSVASSTYESLLDDEGIRKFAELTHNWPDRRLGKDHAARPVLIYCVSLLDPVGSSLLLGHLAALGDRRKVGALLYRSHVVAGVGLRSGPALGREEELRALGAQVLLDLEGIFKTRAAADIAAPVYLVGEKPIDDAESDRAAQISLAGMGIVALTRGSDGHAPNPFEFFIDGAGQPQWAGAPYTPDRPFAAIGGYTAWCPVDRLARLLSARLAATCFEALAGQQSVSTLDLAAKIDLPPNITAFLDALDTNTVRRVWEGVVEPERVPWDNRTTPPPSGCYDLERVRALYGTIFADKEWQRTMRVYGESRLDTPLDAWESEFDELEELIEHGVVPRRKQRVDLITRRILQSFLRSVEAGISEIFDHTFLPPVQTVPHWCAQAYLGRLRRSLLAKQEEVEHETAHDHAIREDPAALRRNVAAIRDQLRKALEAVPSPLAVMLRAAPLFVLGEALFYVCPFDLGWLNSPLMRLVAGAITGGAAMLALFIHQVEGIRSRLLNGAILWLKQYQAVLDLEDEILRHRSYASLLDSMLACLDWLFDGKEDQPPLPHIFEPILKSSREPELDTVPADQLSPQEPLSRFQRYLTAAAGRYRALEQRFLEDFQSSRLETALPEISVLHREVLQSEFASLVGVAQQVDPRPAALDLTSEMRQWLDTRRNERVWMLPFAGGPDKIAELWRRSFLVPGGDELLRPDARLGSSGFQFLSTLQRHLEERFASCFDLTRRVTDYVSQQNQALALTDLYHRYTSRATTSVPVDGQSATHLSAAGPSDPLALNLHYQNSLGAGCISMYLQVSQHIPALQAVSYPDDHDPLTPMGRAWKTHQATPFAGAAFRPVDELTKGASA